VFHQYTLKLHEPDREALREHLAAKNIPCMIYYPVALHMQSAYKDERYGEGHFPVTEELVKQVFSLPMHSELSDEQIDFITSSVLEFINK
jgi:dTDP-4-amino-4,6-dideoxygalactose transaminase